MYWKNFAETRILNVFRGITAIAPSTIYGALYLTAPDQAGIGTEITYVGYERRPVTFSEPTIGANDAVTMNVSDVAFAAPVANAGDVRALAFFDSQVGGNMWASITLDEVLSANANVAPLIIARELNYRTVGGFSSAFKRNVLNLLRGINILGISPHFALYNGNPDAGGSELSGAGYSRLPMTYSAPALQPAGNMRIEIAQAISTSRAQANWGTWNFSAIMTDESGGEVAAIFQEPNANIMRVNNAFTLRVGDFPINVD